MLCIHNNLAVNTFAIGIDNAYEPELKCINKNDIEEGEFHLFNFDSFDDFYIALNKTMEKLTSNPTETDSHGDP